MRSFDEVARTLIKSIGQQLNIAAHIPMPIGDPFVSKLEGTLTPGTDGPPINAKILIFITCDKHFLKRIEELHQELVEEGKQLSKVKR